MFCVCFRDDPDPDPSKKIVSVQVDEDLHLETQPTGKQGQEDSYIKFKIRNEY